MLGKRAEPEEKQNSSPGNMKNYMRRAWRSAPSKTAREPTKSSVTHAGEEPNATARKRTKNRPKGEERPRRAKEQHRQTLGAARQARPHKSERRERNPIEKYNYTATAFSQNKRVLQQTPNMRNAFATKDNPTGNRTHDPFNFSRVLRHWATRATGQYTTVFIIVQ